MHRSRSRSGKWRSVNSFCRKLPFARELCGWAFRSGASVHPSLILDALPGKGFGLVAIHKIEAEAPLISVPMDLCLQSSSETRLDNELPIVELARHICRSSFSVEPEHLMLKHFSDFLLTSLDGFDNEDEEPPAVPWALLPRGRSGALMKSSLPNLSCRISPPTRAFAVPNLPFIHSEDLVVQSHRWECAKFAAKIRELKQGFSLDSMNLCRDVVSIALSRCICSSEVKGELLIAPLIDLCNHSFSPSAACATAAVRLYRGALKEDASSSDMLGVHLISLRTISAGEEVTMQYCDQDPHEELSSTSSDPLECLQKPLTTTLTQRERVLASAERWMMRWGFVPSGRVRTSCKEIRRQLAEITQCSQEVKLDSIWHVCPAPVQLQ